MKETKSKLAVVGMGWKRRNPNKNLLHLLRKEDISKLIFFLIQTHTDCNTET